MAMEDWFESRVAASYRCHRKAGRTGQGRNCGGEGALLRNRVSRSRILILSNELPLERA